MFDLTYPSFLLLVQKKRCKVKDASFKEFSDENTKNRDQNPADNRLKNRSS